MKSGGNNGSGEGRRLPARATSRKGRMKGKGGPENASCIFKGVRQRTWGRWVSEIRRPKTGPRIWLGTFDSAHEAALAYDAAALKLFGPNAHLNLPDEVPPSTVSKEALVLATKSAIASLRGIVAEATNMQSEATGNHPVEEPIFKGAVGGNDVLTRSESTFMNLDSILPEFDDFALWDDASSPEIGDPGTSDMPFRDHANGYEPERPFMG